MCRGSRFAKGVARELRVSKVVDGRRIVRATRSELGDYGFSFKRKPAHKKQCFVIAFLPYLLYEPHLV